MPPCSCRLGDEIRVFVPGGRGKESVTRRGRDSPASTSSMQQNPCTCPASPSKNAVPCCAPQWRGRKKWPRTGTPVATCSFKRSLFRGFGESGCGRQDVV